MENVKEANVLEETIIEKQIEEIKKPVEVEPDAKIVGTKEVTNNIEKVRDYAVSLKEYYSNQVVTEETLKDYKDEKANINKSIKKIADYRKNIVADYKKPIEEFEKLAKETESILKQTYDFINEQCNSYDEKKKQEKVEEAKVYFDELRMKKNISFIQYSNMNQNVTLTKSAKSIREEIDAYLESIESDLNTIETLEDSEQVLIEYMKDRNLARSIKEVQDRKEALKKIEETKVQTPKVEEQPKEETVLQAPIKEEELVECSFKVSSTLTKLKALVEYMKSEGIIYESIK